MNEGSKQSVATLSKLYTHVESVCAHILTMEQVVRVVHFRHDQDQWFACRAQLLAYLARTDQTVDKCRLKAEQFPDNPLFSRTVDSLESRVYESRKMLLTLEESWTR